MCNTSNTNSNTYQLKTNFPESLHRLITNILINYKTLLNRKLYYFLQPIHNLQPIHKHRIPKFYGLPKIHKPPTELGIPSYSITYQLSPFTYCIIYRPCTPASSTIVPGLSSQFHLTYPNTYRFQDYTKYYSNQPISLHSSIRMFSCHLRRNANPF